MIQSGKQMPILQKGDKVGLITPAGFINKSKLETAVQNLEYFGLEAFYYDSVLEKHGYLAGKDKDRLNELHKMFLNKDVNAILCVRGGFGTTRIIDDIDYEIIKRNPKPIIGYSDITALSSAIYSKTNMPGFHGIVGAKKFNDYTIGQFKKVFLDSDETIEISSKNEEESYLINPGEVSGTMFGGNLSLLVSLLGTSFDMNWKDKIILIEETNEPPYKIDRMLMQLISARKFKGVKGIILGSFNKCDTINFDLKDHESLSLKQVIIEKIKPLKIPSVYGFSFGHIDNQAIIPLGIKANFNADKYQITLKRKVIKDFF